MKLALPKFLYRFIPGLGHVIHPGNFHPIGVRRSVTEAVDGTLSGLSARPQPGAGGRWLLVGGSGGFGSAARIALAVEHGAHTLDLSFDTPPNPDSKNRLRKIGSPGWHRARALDEALGQLGLRAASRRVDVFDPAARSAAISSIRELLGGPIDGIVWSLAAPRGLDPRTGKTVSSALRPLGRAVDVKTFANRDAEGASRIESVTLPAGTPEEAVATQYVMGGRPLEIWTMALLEAGLLAEGCRIVTLSYRGNPLNAAIYRDGLIGLAKADLEYQTHALGALLGERVGGGGAAVCGPAVVTEASGGIPGVPLYMALLLDTMGVAHEDPLASMRRLFSDKLKPTGAFAPDADDEGLVRMDDRELSAEVQDALQRRFDQYQTGDRFDDALFDRFMREYGRTRGFGIESVDYQAEFETDDFSP